jgi:hypothetical protein
VEGDSAGNTNSAGQLTKDGALARTATDQSDTNYGSLSNIDTAGWTGGFQVITLGNTTDLTSKSSAALPSPNPVKLRQVCCCPPA